jgi:hypothetical protein
MNQDDYFIKCPEHVDRGDSSRLWTASLSGYFPNYATGTWGPLTTQGLVAQQGQSWSLPMELVGRCKTKGRNL